MPGRKRADRTTPAHRRARTGCKSCRTRKIKCDETKPTCRNCSSRAIVCDNGFQLKWHEEFKTRGVAFGRQGIWTKEPARGSTPKSPSRTDTAPSEYLAVPQIGPHHFLHTRLVDFEPGRIGPLPTDLAVEADEDFAASSAVSPRPAYSPKSYGHTLPRQLSPFSQYANSDIGLLEYYLRRLCPLTTSSRTCSSPFADLILPLFAVPGQDDVLQSLLAFSARHRSIGDPGWTHKAMTLKGGVLSSLQRRLAAVDPANLGAIFSQVLVTMMFLCLYEIVDRCDHRWVIHLRASQGIIRCGRALGFAKSGGSTDGLAAFAERFFAFQDAISRTACGNAPLFGIDYWEGLTDKTQIDSWMGCSPELAGILCDITELGRARSGGDTRTVDFFKHADFLERKIQGLKSTTRSPDDHELKASAELKRMSASLYLHCVLYDAAPTTPLVVRLVRQILERVLRMLRAGHARALAFPVFVAAVELNPADDIVVCDESTGEHVYGRRLILETLNAMSTDSLSNVARTRAVIQKVWRLRDVRIEDNICAQRRESAHISAGNDWATFVGPNSSYISLA